MQVIVADYRSGVHGGRAQYAQELLAYAAAHQPDLTLIPSYGRHIAPPAGARILGLSPIPTATHYQLHGGLLARAWAAERASLRSPARRALFYTALRVNRRRRGRLDDEQRVLAGRARLMVFSAASARELVAAGVASHRIDLSRPGVNLRRFRPALHPLPTCAHRLELAFVAHDFVLKGLPVAIAALAALRRGGIDAALTVAGAGPLRAARRWAREHAVDHVVHFTGAVPQDAVSALFRRVHALVHPTYYDPFPRVVIEALASACPVVTTQCCGAAEVMTSGREGVVLPSPGDADALAAALAPLAVPDVQQPMSRAAATLGQRFDAREHFRAACAWLRRMA